MTHDKVNILLVDDQPAKLLAYEVILRDLGENLIKASTGREALEHLLKKEVAVVLIDVCMPELEARVAERTAELEASPARLRQSEGLRSLALAAGQMGSWAWDASTGECVWDEGHCRIFGVDPATFKVTADAVRPLVDREDWARLLHEGQ